MTTPPALPPNSSPTSIKVEHERGFYELSPSDKQAGLRQGEIISGLYAVRLNRDVGESEHGNALKIVYPQAIVVTQDCDLEQDDRARRENKSIHRLLPHILFCEVEPADIVRYGNKKNNNPNLADTKKVRSEEINSKTWDEIQKNKDERFHYLTHVQPDEDRQNKGLPSLVIEFKRYFAIATEEVYFQLQQTALRRCILTSPYLEHFSTRFSYYQSRVALPKNHY